MTVLPEKVLNRQSDRNISIHKNTSAHVLNANQQAGPSMRTVGVFSSTERLRLFVELPAIRAHSALPTDANESAWRPRS